MSDKKFLDPDVVAHMIFLGVTVNMILSEAKDRSEDFPEAINWADLSCREVLYCVGKEGNVTYQVLIEEASPSCSGLPKFIYDRLTDHKFESVEVRLEW